MTETVTNVEIYTNVGTIGQRRDAINRVSTAVTATVVANFVSSTAAQYLQIAEMHVAKMYN